MDAARYRDSTQIVLPSGSLDGLRGDLEREFTLTIVSEEGTVRLIGSPVVINAASDWLSRHGIFVP